MCIAPEHDKGNCNPDKTEGAHAVIAGGLNIHAGWREYHPRVFRKLAVFAYRTITLAVDKTFFDHNR